MESAWRRQEERRRGDLAVGGIRETEEEIENGKENEEKQESLDDAPTPSSWLIAIATSGSGTTAAGFAF